MKTYLQLDNIRRAVKLATSQPLVNVEKNILNNLALIECRCCQRNQRNSIASIAFRLRCHLDRDNVVADW